jgi:GT2 family glycosyltransferase
VTTNSDPVDVLPVSVVIPTIGRPKLLNACLESLRACRPQADEVLVVDQSRARDVGDVVARFVDVRARVVACEKRGIGLAMNVGLRAAVHDFVLVSHDDCTVAPSWVGTAFALMAEDPTSIVTGRVLPVGDPHAVPSTKDDPAPRDYAGEIHCVVLFPNNMVVNRSLVLTFGGFDERFDRAAEDNDLCYRWLRAGRRIRYEPDLVVWHDGERTREELQQLYVAYGEGQGRFYAKHLRAGDLTMLRFLAADLHAGLRGLAAAALRRRPQVVDPRPRVARGLPVGLVKGWREFDPDGGRSRPGTADDDPFG